MERQEFAEISRLDITVVSPDRSKEIVFKPAPNEQGKQERNIVMWTRKRNLSQNVWVVESQFGELRVIKQVALQDTSRSTGGNYRSELDVMGRVSKATEYVHLEGL